MAALSRSREVTRVSLAIPSALLLILAGFSLLRQGCWVGRRLEAPSMCRLS